MDKEVSIEDREKELLAVNRILKRVFVLTGLLGALIGFARCESFEPIVHKLANGAVYAIGALAFQSGVFGVSVMLEEIRQRR